MGALNSILAQGSTLHVGKSGVAVAAISAISKAYPAVATKTAHGLTTGAVVKINDAGGMTEINGLVAVVRVLTVDTFELCGIDSTEFTNYTTGASVTPTECKVNGLLSTSESVSEAPEIDVTDLDSQEREMRSGLGSGSGTVSLSLQRIYTDDGQNALLASLRAAGVLVDFKLTIKDKPKTFQAKGACISFPVVGELGVDALVTASASLRISGGWK